MSYLIRAYQKKKKHPLGVGGAAFAVPAWYILINMIH
jgi:hypothetical protein